MWAEDPGSDYIIDYMKEVIKIKQDTFSRGPKHIRIGLGSYSPEHMFKKKLIKSVPGGWEKKLTLNLGLRYELLRTLFRLT